MLAEPANIRIIMIMIIMIIIVMIIIIIIIIIIIMIIITIIMIMQIIQNYMKKRRSQALLGFCQLAGISQDTEALMSPEISFFPLLCDINNFSSFESQVSRVHVCPT